MLRSVGAQGPAPDLAQPDNFVASDEHWRAFLQFAHNRGFCCHKLVGQPQQRPSTLRHSMRHVLALARESDMQFHSVVLYNYRRVEQIDCAYELAEKQLPSRAHMLRNAVPMSQRDAKGINHREVAVAAATVLLPGKDRPTVQHKVCCDLGADSNYFCSSVARFHAGMSEHERGSELTMGIEQVPVKNGPPSVALLIIDGFEIQIEGRQQPKDKQLPFSLLSCYTCAFLGIDVNYIMMDQFMNKSKYPVLRFRSDVLADLRAQVAAGKQECVVHFEHDGKRCDGYTVRYVGSKLA